MLHVCSVMHNTEPAFYMDVLDIRLAYPSSSPGFPGPFVATEKAGKHGD